MKRTFHQTMPEPAPEPIQGTAIVVIHPGSQNLIIGRASDPVPLRIPHCIAWRHKKKKQPHNADNWIIRKESSHSDSASQIRQGLKAAEEALLSRPTSTGEFRQPISYKQLSSENSMLAKDSVITQTPTNWTDTHHKPEYLIGEQALKLSPTDCYDIFWPMRRGRLNIHSGLHGSLAALLQDMEFIWSEAIKTHLEIPLQDLKHYRAILLIPDIYNRINVKEMMNLLLIRLGFGAAFVTQESICATFGTGVSSACVVDVGDQKTSVTCVEDGLSHKDTRFLLEYGGSDVLRSFHWLLNRISFPYKECSLNWRMDILFLQTLKESSCHLDQDKMGITTQQYSVRKSNGKVQNFNMKIGDEKILAAMGLFFTDILGLRGENLVQLHERTKSDPEDPLDDHYLRQTTQQAKFTSSKKKESAEITSQSLDTSLQPLEENTQLSQSQYDEDSNDPEVLDNRRKQDYGFDVESETLPLLGIDQAILRSIDNCDSDDMKKRMYSCIIVVGGGMMFNGAQGWLQYRIWTQMPGHFRLQLETMDVITKPKDLDAQFTCWKGASVMSCLDTTQELWIKQKEWKRHSIKVLRERAPFIW